MNEVTAYIGLGGNLGEPKLSMARALRAIDEGRDTCVVNVSSVYKTPPWGKLDQPWFMNACAQVSTGLSARALLDFCLNVETELKRRRNERWGPRLIDIDILLFGDDQIDDEGLSIPHPRICERAFVLYPLYEIAPEILLNEQPIAFWKDRSDSEGIEKIKSEQNWWV